MSKLMSKLITGKLISLERLPSSFYGNPRYTAVIRTDNDNRVVLRTAPDAAIGYGITNYMNKQVILEYKQYYGFNTIISCDYI